MSATNGGPAFPHGASVKVYDSYMESRDKAEEISSDFHPGMSLRDWFAGKAIQGILANGSPAMMAIGAKEAEERGETRTEETWSRWAYEVADAMLRAKEKP